MGKIPHQLLRAKVAQLWKPIEPLILIDLGWDFFVVKFRLEKSMNKILIEGPWFVTGHFLSISRWEPNFVTVESKLSTTAIWIRLPQLPIEFYDKSILEQVGNMIGKLLKIDTCTSSTLCGRYVRICVRVLLDIPSPPPLPLAPITNPYEREGIICNGCGIISHTLRNYSFLSKPKKYNS